MFGECRREEDEMCMDPAKYISTIIEFEFIRKIQYNDNIKYCGLLFTGASRIEKAKYNTHGQYNDDERFTCTRNKFNIYKCCA